jgi:hypothetical protein
MTERVSSKPASAWWAVSLILVVVGILVAAGAAAMLQGSGEAHAAPSDYLTANKSNTAEVAQNGEFDWWTSVTNNSDTSQTVDYFDDYARGSTLNAITDYQVLTSGPAPVCDTIPVGGRQDLSCTLIVPAHSTVYIAIHFSPPFIRCTSQNILNFLHVTQGGEDVAGSPDANNSYLVPGDPSLCPPSTATFQLCKIWTPQGVIASNRSFTFNVSDTSQTQQIVVSNVAENGVPVCVPVTANLGVVDITETVPGGFDTPHWNRDGREVDDSGDDDFMEMFLEADTCFSNETALRAAEAADVVAENDCIVTFTNEDNDTPPPSPSPSTSPTPFDPPCPRCNTPAVPTATNTPVPPPPTNTPVAPPPPTATPTTGSGSTTLTDENRTQTAIAAAKTAAAQFTPIAPRTGDGAGAGSGNGALNLAFAVAGMVTLGAGLSLIAARRRR